LCKIKRFFKPVLPGKLLRCDRKALQEMRQGTRTIIKTPPGKMALLNPKWVTKEAVSQGAQGLEAY